MSAWQKTAYGLALLAALWAAGARAQETCAPQDEGETVSDHRLLRQLSLDLRGRIPTIQEYRRLEEGEAVDTLLSEMLESEEYFAQVRDDHRALLWGSLGQIDDMAPGGRRIRRTSSGIWRVTNNRRRYRGRNNVECLNQAQPASEYDSAGRPRALQTFSDSSCDGGTCRREGYVMVRPYWAPDTPVKVCAFDAMSVSTGRDGNRCDIYNPDPGCGCGPNLRHCMPETTSPAQRAVRDALEQEAPRIFEHIIREGRSYLEAFTTRETLVNGPSAFYYENFAGAETVGSGGARVYDPALGELPDLTFQDEGEWRVIERSEAHAGVLTTLLFDLRFASNRSRANRFYTAFRCEPFVPPTGGLPAETSGDPDPNLRERDGCRSCHQTLEVAAAHFGRWRNDTTFGLLPSSAMDPLGVRDDCATCGDGTRCSNFCNAYFVTRDNSHEDTHADWAGYPLVRAYLDDTEAAAVDVGPAGLVDEPDEIERVASCTVRTVAERMLGRELTRDEHVTWVPELAESFATSGYDYTALIRSMAESQTYRQVR